MPDPKDSLTTVVQEKMLQEQILRDPPQNDTVACELCLKEIPKSLAHYEEMDDMCHYFCSHDCANKWEHQNNANKAQRDAP